MRGCVWRRAGGSVLLLAIFCVLLSIGPSVSGGNDKKFCKVSYQSRNMPGPGLCVFIAGIL